MDKNTHYKVAYGSFCENGKWIKLVSKNEDEKIELKSNYVLTVPSDKVNDAFKAIKLRFKAQWKEAV